MAHRFIGGCLHELHASPSAGFIQHIVKFRPPYALCSQQPVSQVAHAVVPSTEPATIADPSGKEPVSFDISPVNPCHIRYFCGQGLSFFQGTSPAGSASCTYAPCRPSTGTVGPSTAAAWCRSSSMLDIGHSLSTTAPAARTCAAVQGPAMQTQAHSTCSWTCLASPKPNDCSILLRAGAKNARQHDYPVLRPRHAFSLMLQRSLHHSTSQQAAVHAQSGPPGQERASNSAHSTSQHTAACTSTSTSTLIQLPQIASLGEVAQPAAAAPAAASAASAAAFAAQQATANTGLAGAVGIGGASSNSSSAANAAVQAAGGSASAVGQAASAAGPTGRTTTTRTDAGAAIDKDPGRVSKYAENEVEDDDDDDLDYPVVPPEVELEPPSWAYMMGIAGLGAVLAVAVAGLGIMATFSAGTFLREVSKELQKPQHTAAQQANEPGSEV